MVGMIAGVLSSLLLATPILVDLKMRDTRFQQQAARVAARRAKAAGLVPGAEGAASDTDPDLADDAVLAGELRKERAMAAAASVPARQSRGGGQHRGARPSGKAARPTGKRQR
jgi:preprotein translocase subunit SecF